ncbi:MAG: MarR family transcriptional regulator [Bacteriovoracia bacterium]
MSKNLLNSPLERFTRMMFSRVIERLAVIMAEQELSFSQVAALHIVDQADHISIQDLALRLNLSLSATSRLVDDLVQRKQLDRIEDQDNRRTKLLSLTTDGREFLNQLSLERVKIIKTAPRSFFETLGKHP